MVFGWLINLLKSIFGFGSKDAGTLKEQEDKLEEVKSGLRIRQDKLRAKQARLHHKEDRDVRKEFGELGNIFRGETPEAEEKDLKKLIHEDERIRGELLGDERLASQVEQTGRVIGTIDRREEADEAQIRGTAGAQSPRTVSLHDDVLYQAALIQREERQLREERGMEGLYKIKGQHEKLLLRVEEQMRRLYPDEEAYSRDIRKNNYIQTIDHQAYIRLQGYKERLLQKIKTDEKHIEYFRQLGYVP